jgi:two-component system CheB/CheR fusion protein
VRLTEFLEVLVAEARIDLRGYKHTTLERRLRRRMDAVHAATFDDYLEIVRRKPEETNALLETVLINVTEFFRDPQAWDVIGEKVLPELTRDLRPGHSLRAWVAGCSTGEEVYSLAILLAEHFGPRIAEFDVKIYATDVDQDALNAARRGEYANEKLRKMRPQWRERYFSGTSPRVNRDLRRLAIFGRSDLARDAPISHVSLVICRNVLIYFDTSTQHHILARLHYALDQGGVLFLGKAESKLSNSVLFRPIHSRWRIFRRLGNGENGHAAASRSENPVTEDGAKSTKPGDLALLNHYHRALLDVLETGITMLDDRDVVLNENESVLQLWGLKGKRMAGKPIYETGLGVRCPELAARMEESRRSGQVVRFQASSPADGEKILEVTIQPVFNEAGQRIGTLIYSGDGSQRQRLQSTIQKLEATSEQLQSANEELETTNEELQSTNEELETTNEELQSLNEELENMNEELEFRTRELDALNVRYADTLERMPWAVSVLDSGGKIQFWNSAAQKLFNLQAASVVGLELEQLPIPHGLRQAISRRMRQVLKSRSGSVLRGQKLRTARAALEVEAHFTPLSRDGEAPSVLLMFSSVRDSQQAAEAVRLLPQTAGKAPLPPVPKQDTPKRKPEKKLKG